MYCQEVRTPFCRLGCRCFDKESMQLFGLQDVLTVVGGLLTALLRDSLLTWFSLVASGIGFW